MLKKGFIWTKSERTRHSSYSTIHCFSFYSQVPSPFCALQIHWRSQNLRQDSLPSFQAIVPPHPPGCLLQQTTHLIMFLIKMFFLHKKVLYWITWKRISPAIVIKIHDLSFMTNCLTTDAAKTERLKDSCPILHPICGCSINNYHSLQICMTVLKANYSFQQQPKQGLCCCCVASWCIWKNISPWLWEKMSV